MREGNSESAGTKARRFYDLYSETGMARCRGKAVPEKRLMAQYPLRGVLKRRGDIISLRLFGLAAAA